MSADHVYVNLSITNNSSTTGATFNPQCKFTETRSSGIVSKADDYYLSCVRFSVPTGAIPMMIAPMDMTVADNQTMPWTLSL